MASNVTHLEYELNGHNGVSVTKGDIGMIVGKGASGIKKVISGAWLMYERVQSSENKVDEDKPKLRILLKDHDEGVTAEIISESETMQKLAQRSLDKHIMEFKKKNQLKTQHYVIELNERLVGKLVGKKAAGIKRILNDAIYQNKKVMINKDDVETAKTARLYVNDIKVDSEDIKQVIDYVSKKPNCSFLGWPPSEDDEYENHIEISISFKYDAKPFVEKELYIQRISEIITSRINQIREEDDDQMDEINECLGFD
tara:strand:- start:1293 stop:2060 length:768 start_codon:yes stop_codon:yes gene_type:complete